MPGDKMVSITAQELAELREAQTRYHDGRLTPDARQAARKLLGSMPGTGGAAPRFYQPETVFDLLRSVESVSDLLQQVFNQKHAAEEELAKIKNSLAGLGQVLKLAADVAEERHQRGVAQPE